MDLVNLIVTWKQREERDDLEKDTSKAPHIHLVPIVSISQETLRSTIPSGRNVLRVGLFGVNASTGSEIGQFNVIIGQKDVFGLDVSVENAVSMHVINRFQELIHIVLDAILWKIVSFTLDCIIHVDVHQLKHKRQTSCWLII